MALKCITQRVIGDFMRNFSPINYSSLSFSLPPSSRTFVGTPLRHYSSQTASRSLLQPPRNVSHQETSQRTLFTMVSKCTGCFNMGTSGKLLAPNRDGPLMGSGYRFKSTKGRYYMPFRYDPLKLLKQGGFAARMSTPSGRKVLMRRMLKGMPKWKLTH